MTFDKQVQKAKEEKLKNRITRDIIFIVLGVIFLSISIYSAYKDNSNNKTIKEQTKKVTTNYKK